jgi:mannitol-specific phosphotransferase system IIBC component
LINPSRRAAAVAFVVVSILTVTAASAAGIYWILVLLSEKHILGFILAALIIAATVAFIFSWILLGGDAAQKNKNS